jgi:hypothetical protein
MTTSSATTFCSFELLVDYRPLRFLDLSALSMHLVLLSDLSLSKSEIIHVRNWLISRSWRYMGECNYTPQFLTSAQNGEKWLASSSDSFTTGEAVPCMHCIERRMGRSASLDAMHKKEKLLPLQRMKHRFIGLPDRGLVSMLPRSSVRALFILKEAIAWLDGSWNTFLLISSLVTFWQRHMKQHCNRVSCPLMNADNCRVC